MQRGQTAKLLQMFALIAQFNQIMQSRYFLKLAKDAAAARR